MKEKFSVPRFFYRNVNEDLDSIRQEAAKSSARQAIVNFIKEREDRLPENTSVEDVVNAIMDTTYEFSRAMNGADTKEDFDFAKELGKAIENMEAKEAYTYLATLSVVMNICNANAVAGDDVSVPDAETLKNEIARTVNSCNESGKTVEECVDELVNEISDSNSAMKRFVYATGNEALVEILKMTSFEPEEEATEEANGEATEEANGEVTEEANGEVTEEVTEEVTDKPLTFDDLGISVFNIVNDAFSDADRYAMLATACYGQVLDGKVEGVTAEDLEPGMLAALVSAGAAKGTVLQRLLRGEINKDTAMDLLAAIEVGFRWVLARFIQLQVGKFVLEGLLGIFLKLCTLIGLHGVPVAIFFVGLAMLLGFGAAVSSKDEAEALANFMVDLLKKINDLPVIVFNGVVGLFTKLFKYNNVAIAKEGEQKVEGDFEYEDIPIEEIPVVEKSSATAY